MRKDLNPGGVLLWDIGYFSHSVLPEYHSSLVELMARIPNIKITSDDSDHLDGIDVDGILKPIDEAWNKHIVDKDNPHKETAKVLNILLKHEIDGLLSKKLKQNLVPISWYGYDPVTFSELETNDLFTLGNGSITLKENSALMVGALYRLSSKTFTIPLNTSLDIYVKLTPAGAEFKSGKEVFNIAETNPQMYICTVTNKSGSMSTNYSPIVRVGTNRFSFIPKGSAFPIGLGGPNNTTEGIHLDWKPYKVGISLLRWDTGANGFTTSTQDGNLLLVADAGLNPNLYFDVIGEIVNVTSKVETIAGSGGNITKVNNSNFRVGLGGYGNFKVTFRATIHNGKWEEVSVYFLFRNLLKLWLSSTTLDNVGGNNYTGRTDTTYTVSLGYGGDGVSTRYSLSNVSGPSPTVTKVNESTYRIVTKSNDNVFRLSFTATDRYGRSITTPTISVNVRKALPPILNNWELWQYRSEWNPREFVKGGTHFNIPNVVTPTSWSKRSPFNNYVDIYAILRLNINPGHTARFVSLSPNGYVFVGTWTKQNTHWRDPQPPDSVWYNDPRYPNPLYQLPFKMLSSNQKYNFQAEIVFDVVNEVGEYQRFKYRFLMPKAGRPPRTSCFTADTLVTMADMSTKRMVDVKKGDMVWTPFGPKVCSGLFKTKLGHRPLVSFGGKAKTSAEHSMWGREPGTDDQFWCTRDMYGWIMEARTGYGPQFGNQLPVDLEDMKEWEFATINGWSKESWDVNYDVDPETTLYNVEFEEGSIYCVDGYLTSTMASVNCDVDWSSVKWDGKDISYNKRDRTPKDFVFDYPKVLPSKYHGFLFDEDTIRELQHQILEGYKDGDN